jgi:hypothetical protein
VAVVVVVVVASSSGSSSSSSTTIPSSSGGVVVSSSVSSSRRGRLNCPKASCMMIVLPYPRLDGNNNSKRTLKLMVAAIIAGLHLLSPKKANLSFIVMTTL